MAEMNHRQFLKNFLQVENVLKAYLYAACGDPHTVDDLLQEISSVLWEKFEQYDEDRPFRNWALGIARLETLKWRQRLARSREVLSPAAVEALADSVQEHAAELDERAPHLRSCIERLKHRTRHVLRLRYWKGLAIKQIADELGRSVASVEMVLVRTRRQLRLCVESKLARSEGGRL